MSFDPLMIGRTGLEAQQVQAAATANNLANAGTTGFKATKPIFKELMYQKIRQPGGENNSDSELPSGLMLGTGVRVAGTAKDFKAGSPIRTDNPLDLYINGKGFFRVLLHDGSIAYTRDGQLQTDSNGNLVDSEGRQLQPNITIPAGARSITIGRDGTVSVMTTGATSETTVGTIQLADFMNPAGLEPIGDNLYLETAASGSPNVGNPAQNGIGQIEQLSLEGSNVNVVKELVNLIEGQRQYEMNAKGIETFNEMLKYATQIG